jgi:hypothetical protein
MIQPPSTRRNLLLHLFGLASLPLLSSCGTFIYPERVNQKGHGNLDPAVVILDGIGLIFFIIPGLIAFAVDFGTHAIYFPEGKDENDKERTIFDHWKDDASEDTAINQHTLEKFIAWKTGHRIQFQQEQVLVKELESLDQFHVVYQELNTRNGLARS